MSWARLDDDWTFHPKVIGCDLAARGLWVSALSWSCRSRTPIVPAAFPAMFAADEATVNQLEANGLWHGPGHDCLSCDDPGAGWIIHDWAEYQDKSLSEKRAEAGRKGGIKSGKTRRAKAAGVASTVEANPQANVEAGSRTRTRTRNPTPSAAGAAREEWGPVAKAVATACRMDLPPHATREAVQLQVVVADLRQHGATADEVARRGRVWRDRHDKPLTPMALSSHWSKLVPPPLRVVTEVDQDRQAAVRKASGLAAAGEVNEAAAILEAVGLSLDDVAAGAG